MDHLAGLDVSVKETSVCIVDDTGRMVREADISKCRVELSGICYNYLNPPIRAPRVLGN